MSHYMSKDICGHHKRVILTRKPLYFRESGPNSKRMKRAVLIASTLFAVLTVAAQTPTTLRVDVRLVNIVATVTDADGKFVPGLSAEDFTVLEDGVAQKISHFT